MIPISSFLQGDTSYLLILCVISRSTFVRFRVFLLLNQKLVLLLLCGFAWRLASNKSVKYRHQSMWSVDPNIYSILRKKRVSISRSKLLFLSNNIWNSFLPDSCLQISSLNWLFVLWSFLTKFLLSASYFSRLEKNMRHHFEFQATASHLCSPHLILDIILSSFPFLPALLISPTFLCIITNLYIPVITVYILLCAFIVVFLFKSTVVSGNVHGGCCWW